MRLQRIGFAGLALALAAAACGGGRAEETVASTQAAAQAQEFTPGPLGAVEVRPGEKIQIRSLNSISGDQANLGTPNQRGVELAVADYGPIAGREVALGTGMDDLCSAEGGQAAAQAIVADPDVVGVIGTTCSAAAVAVSPLISEAGLVMISPSNTSPALTSDLAGTPGTGWNPGYLRTSSNDLYQGRAVASFVKEELGLDTAAAIHDGDPFTQGLAQAFKDAYEAIDGEITAFTSVNKGDTDMTAVLTEAAAAQPQALFFPIFMPEGGSIVQQVRGTAGLEDTVLIASAALLTDNFMELPESEGVYMSGPDLRFGANRNSHTAKTADQLLADYEEAYGEGPTAGYWAHSYDAATMLLAAVEKTAVEVDGSLYIDRSALREAVYASDFGGIIGPITCDEFGDCGSNKLTIILHRDSRDIDASLDNIVFDFAP